jgi:hypothetical protein
MYFVISIATPMRVSSASLLVPVFRQKILAALVVQLSFTTALRLSDCLRIFTRLLRCFL